MFRTQNAAEGAGRLGGLALDLEKARVEHILDQGGFSGAGYAGDADETAQRDLDRDVAQIVGGDALQQQTRRRRSDGQRSGRLNLDVPPHVLAGQGVCLAQRIGRSIENDLPSTFAGPRAHVDDAVGGDHHLGIVLDDHQRVTGIAQAVHHLDHAMDIARVQPDRRLVEHEECVDQRCAERRGQVDALDLAARQRSALTVKREVAQPDVAEKLQAGANLGEHQIHRGIHQRALEGQVVDERTQIRNRCQHQILDGFAPDAPEQGVRLETGAVARRARRVAAVLGQHDPHVHLVRLGFEPGEKALNPVPLRLPGLLAAFPLRITLQHPVPVLGRQVLPRRIDRDVQAPRELDHLILAFLETRGLPGLDGAFVKRAVFIRDHQAVVDPDHASKAAARFARAQRGVKGKRAGQRLCVADIAIGAVEPVAELPDCLVVALVIERVNGNDAVAHAQGRVERFHDPRLFRAGKAKPVLNNLQRAQGNLRLAGAGFARPGRGRRRRRLRDAGFVAVQPRVTLPVEKSPYFLFGKVGRHPHGEGDDEPRIAETVRALAKRREDRPGAILAHALAATAAKQRRAAGKQQLQVVVELGHRADRAARTAHRIRLVDCNRRQDALDAVHLRFVHAVEELSCVGRERFDVATLPFGVERVERERTLA